VRGVCVYDDGGVAVVVIGVGGVSCVGGNGDVCCYIADGYEGCVVVNVGVDDGGDEGCGCVVVDNDASYAVGVGVGNVGVTRYVADGYGGIGVCAVDIGAGVVATGGVCGVVFFCDGMFDCEVVVYVGVCDIVGGVGAGVYVVCGVGGVGGVW